MLDKQTTPPEIARLLDCSPTTVYNVKRRFLAEALEQALTERGRARVLAILKEREELEIKIEWQFSINQAREKLNRHYEKVILKT